MAKEKNIDYALRVGYMSLLDGNTTINGEVIPWFKEGAAIGSEDIYGFIQSVGGVEDNSKASIDTITNIQISLFAKGEELDGTEIEDLTAQVLDIVEPKRGFRVPINSNFNIVEQKVISSNNIPVVRYDTTIPVYEHHIIIEHRVTHLGR